jgi:hypothetical protein
MGCMMAIERTPSDTLMSALEKVEGANDLMIIVITNDGNIEWYSTTDLLHRKLGMIEFVRECIKENIREVKGDA